MGLFSKSSSNAGKPRRSSPQRNDNILQKIKDDLADMEKLDRQIKKIDDKLKDQSNPLTNAAKELFKVKRLSLSGQKDELQVRIDGYKKTIEERNKKNLDIAQSKYGKKN